MRVWELIAPAFLAITAAAFSAHVGSAQTPDLQCTQLPNVPDDGAPLAVGLNDLASKKIDPSQAESACRSALRADPVNPTFMFLLGRALSLGNKRQAAIKYYLDAADRGHAGAMNDLGGVFEYGVGVPKNLPTALLWYEKAAELPVWDHSHRNDGTFSRDQFKFDKERNVYVCPMGKLLKTTGR